MKKYLFYGFLSMVISAFSFTAYSLDSDSVFSPGKAKITATVLNVRNIASIGGTLIGEVKRGDIVQVIDRSKNQSEIDGQKDYWYKVEFSGQKTGWVFGAYITFEVNLEQGLRWKSVVPASKEVYTGIAVSPDKSIVAGTLSGNVYQSKDRGKTWKKIIPQALGNTISSIGKILTSGTEIWITSTGKTESGGGVWKTSNNGMSWSQYTKAQGLPSNHVNDIFIAKDKKIWLATSKGVCFSSSEGSNWQALKSYGLQGEALSIIAIDSGLIIVGTERGLFKNEISKKNSRWIRIHSEIKGKVGSLAVHGDMVFAGTEKGLAKANKSKIDDWKIIGGGSEVASIVIDPKQRVLVATNNGLNISLDKGESWVTYKKEHGLASSIINSIAVDNMNIIWVTMNENGIGYHD